MQQLETRILVVTQLDYTYPEVTHIRVRYHSSAEVLLTVSCAIRDRVRFFHVRADWSTGLRRRWKRTLEWRQAAKTTSWPTETNKSVGLNVSDIDHTM